MSVFLVITSFSLILVNDYFFSFSVFNYRCSNAVSGTALAQRVAIDSVPHIREAKKAIRKAFQNEKEKRGLSIIEVLSTCPTNWGLSPVEAMGFVKDKMIPYYPLGVYKDVTAEEAEA